MNREDLIQKYQDSVKNDPGNALFYLPIVEFLKSIEGKVWKDIDASFFHFVPIPETQAFVNELRDLQVPCGRCGDTVKFIHLYSVDYPTCKGAVCHKCEEWLDYEFNDE